MGKRRRLYNLNPHEISLVSKGANLKKFLVHKSEAPTMPDLSVVEKAVPPGRPIPPGLRRPVPTPAPPIPAAAHVATPVATPVHPAAVAPAPAAVAPAAVAQPAVVPAQPIAAPAAPAEVPPGMQQPTLPAPAQAALKAVARILAPHKDVITDTDVDQVLAAIGIASDSGSDDDGEDDDDEQDDENSDDAPDIYTGKNPAVGQVQPNNPGYVAMALGDDVHVNTPLGDAAINAADKMRIKKPNDVADEHHAAAVGAAKSSYVETLAKNGYKLKTSDDEKDQKGADKMADKVEKQDGVNLDAFAPEQRTQLEAIFKAHGELLEANKVLVQKNADLEKEIAVEREQRVMKAFEAKAAAFKRLGAPADKLGKILKSLTDADKESAEALESILKSANEQLAVADENLMGEIGTSMNAAMTGSAGSAQAELDALVDGVVRKSGTPMSKEQAAAIIMKTAEGKKLVRRINAEQERRIRNAGGGWDTGID